MFTCNKYLILQCSYLVSTLLVSFIFLTFCPTQSYLPRISTPCAHCYLEFLPPVLTVTSNLRPLCKQLLLICAPYANCYLEFLPPVLMLPRISTLCANCYLKFQSP